MKTKINHFYILSVLAFSLCFLEIMNAQKEKKNFSNIDYSLSSKKVIPDNRKVYKSDNSENDSLKKLNNFPDSSSNAMDNQDDTFFNSKCIVKVVL
jgi:hypothetical protein